MERPSSDNPSVLSCWRQQWWHGTGEILLEPHGNHPSFVPGHHLSASQLRDLLSSTDSWTPRAVTGALSFARSFLPSLSGVTPHCAPKSQPPSAWKWAGIPSAMAWISIDPATHRGGRWQKINTIIASNRPTENNRGIKEAPKCMRLLKPARLQQCSFSTAIWSIVLKTFHSNLRNALSVGFFTLQAKHVGLCQPVMWSFLG